jgi:3-oxoacyl-[acyl-carrier-protein] synthase-3
MTGSAVLAGIGTWLPDRLVSNASLSATLDTSDEWIRSRTGIVDRYYVRPGTSTSDMAVQAGHLALDSSGDCGVDTVDAVIVATTTPDHICPATAPTVAARLGFSGLPAFDIGAVCSGFVYGLASATGMISAGLADSVLLIGADTFSTIVDPTDRTTAVIFGDGAGAVVLRAGRADEPGAIQQFDLGSDGDNASIVGVAGGGSRQRSTGPCPERDHYLAMDGRKLYKQAIKRMTASCHAVLDRSGWLTSDVDVLVPHQANARICAGVAEALELPAHRAFVHIEKYGNTAAASIPIALADAARRGVLQPGHRTLVTAFGAGLTWGSATFTWPEIKPQHNFLD